MHRFLTTIFILICTAGLLYAADGTMPPSDATAKTRMLYLHAHRISNHFDKDFNANNHLMVWNQGDTEIGFMMAVISNDNHECLMEGTAVRGRDGRYEYRENKCQLSFAVGPDQVDLDVKGSGGKTCRATDLREGHGCGYNTSIDPGVYKKAQKAGLAETR